MFTPFKSLDILIVSNKVNKMEEKDVNSIASAVTTALSKLNADAAKEAADKRSDNKGENNESETETFNCPECGAAVKGGIAYCQGCGCPLEWEQ